jgi:methylglutamate dehydrogenase subunit C
VYLNRYALRLGQKVVVVTTHDSAWRVAMEMAAAGADVPVVEGREAVDASWLEEARQHNVAVRLHASPVQVLGGRWVTAIDVQSTQDGRRERLACDLVAMSGGWAPAIQLTTHTGVRAVFDTALGLHVAGSLPAHHAVVGAMSGRPLVSLEAAHLAGERAARHCGAQGEAGACVETTFAAAPLMASGLRTSISSHAKAFIDVQSDVTVADLDLSLEDGFESPEHLKRYTALGMATDQGKNSHHHGLRILAERRGQALGALGTTTHRPPFTPVTVGALAGRSVGLHFRPTRRTPLHHWHLQNGARMIEAGPWLRPWYYEWAGSDVATAYIGEMRHVRSAVGISDVSSLGKIEIVGPDTGAFLDRVYVNNFSSLAVGKARYGVMLNDDGTVLDDGTTSRFGANRYFMTTTTAQAGEVMSWLEFLLQTVWPELKVHVVSVTDRWAGFSLAGPLSRAVLEKAFPQTDVSGEKLPHMGVLETEWSGVAVRIARLSFSGELAYEVYVPADAGVAMWTHLLDVGAFADIRPYGLESLASLRIEKGHVAGLELDHRNTLDDLGLGKMASRVKPYIGQALSQRAELKASDRWSLVGLELIEPAGQLRGGAILFAANDRIEGHGRGYITSVTWSTVHERLIALALYQGGLRHLGEEIVCAYPLRGEQVRARIVSPMFFDPQGERLHA